MTNGSTFATLAGSRRQAAAGFEMEAAGIPVIGLRVRTAGVRLESAPIVARGYELLIPASCETSAIERFGRAREQALAEVRREPSVDPRAGRGGPA
jgi:hypothetical protein